MERLETEESLLKQSLSDIAKRQPLVVRIGEEARALLETWQDVGELPDAATEEERLQILQHYIEVIELGPIDPHGLLRNAAFPESPAQSGVRLRSGRKSRPNRRKSLPGK